MKWRSSSSTRSAKERRNNEQAANLNLFAAHLETRLGTVPAVTYRQGKANDECTGPIGRSASKKNHSSKAKIRTCQSDYGDNKYLETGNEVRD